MCHCQEKVVHVLLLVVRFAVLDMKVAELVRKADPIIWDEALMMHRQAFEIVDWTLRDLMQLDDAQATEKIFGGKTVVLGGDF